MLLERGFGALVVVRVEHEQHRPVADERELAEQRLVVVGPLDALGQRAVHERRVQGLEHLELVLGRLVAAARRLAGLVEAALHQLGVAQHELGLHQVHVGARVVRVAHVRDLGVLEHAHHVRHGVHAADVAEEPVAQALAAARALGQPGDVDEVDGGVDLPGRLEHLVQRVQARVRHGDDAEVGLGGGERVGRRGGLRVGERVEQGGLADVRQTDDAELHECLPSLLVSRVSRRRDMSRSWSLTLPGNFLST